MKLIVDGYYLGNGRGMSRYVEALLESAPSVPLIESPPQRSWLPAKVQSLPPVWEQWLLPTTIRRYPGSVLLCGFNTGPLRLAADVRLVQVLHDLIFLSSLDELPLSRSIGQNLGRLYRRIVAPRVALRADVILTVSEFSKSEIVRRLGVDASRVMVIPNSIPDRQVASTATPAHARKRIVFTVSGDAPSKNLEGALQTFALFVERPPHEDWRLLIAGVPVHAQQHFRVQAAALGVDEKVEFLPRISDEDLQNHYRSAFAYLCTSWQEGFGIPVLEAMAQGLPVVSSNRTSLPEVIGDAGLLYDPSVPADGADALTQLRAQDGMFDTFSKRALERSKCYTRSAVAPQIEAFWQLLASDRRIYR